MLVCVTLKWPPCIVILLYSRPGRLGAVLKPSINMQLLMRVIEFDLSPEEVVQ